MIVGEIAFEPLYSVYLPESCGVTIHQGNGFVVREYPHGPAVLRGVHHDRAAFWAEYGTCAPELDIS